MSEKRERQKANRQAKAEQLEKQENSEVVRQRVLLGVVMAVLVFGGLFLVSQLGGDDEADSATTTPTTAGEVTTTASTEPLPDPVDLAAPAAGAAITGETPCPADDGSAERTTSFEQAPPMCIDDTKTYTAEMTTSKGVITIELDAARAPLTVNNFVVLSRYGYYENVPFHRIIPGFVIQGGDAVGAPLGTGNPGYAVEDELPEPDEYEIGSLAMANSGPDTNGSQFFIITGEAGMNLNNDFSLFGMVTDGLDIVEDLDAIGTPGDGRPLEEVIIESVVITES